MIEAQYAQLAAGCDRLLRAPGTSLARLAIPALHFLNEHPSSLAQYAPLFAARPPGRFAELPRALLRGARGLLRSLAMGRAREPADAAFDVVIVSHLLRPEQLRQQDDFYFGALQRHLQERGASSLLVLIDHLPATASREHPLSFASPRLLLPTAVSWTTEAGIWRQCTGAWRALRHDAARARGGAERGLAMLASRQALSAATVINLRMHAAIAELCQAINPRILITTYEGTVAERLIWHAARTARHRPLCVGYQHALVLERAHAIRRAVAAPNIDCDPDVILTLGALSHTALAASAGLQPRRLIRYGSHRHATLPVLPQPQQRPRHCLVLPDASDPECATLFEFALRCAHHSPELTFTLRPHPMVDTQALLRRHPALQGLPANVTFSVDQPLEREFAQARYCLYRGSSAALYAARAGIKPFYLARPGELACDCLFALGDWRETVTSPQEFADRIRVADACADADASGRAADLCAGYVWPLRPAALDELLAMVPAC